MLTLDRILATVGLIGFWGLVYVYGVVPFQESISAYKDEYNATAISKALVVRYQDVVSTSQCQTPPSGVTLQSLVSDKSLSAEVVNGTLYTASFRYNTANVNTPSGGQFERVTGITVTFTYPTIKQAQDVAGYVAVDNISGSSLSFYTPIRSPFSQQLSGHIDKNTGCTRKING